MFTFSSMLKSRRVVAQKKTTRKLALERLEERLTPSAAYAPIALAPALGPQNPTTSIQSSPANLPATDSGGGAGQFGSHDSLQYFGGPLIANVNLIPVYVTDGNTNAVLSDAEKIQFNTFLQNIATNGYITTLLKQYSFNPFTIGNGTLNGLEALTTITPNTTINDSQTPPQSHPLITDSEIRTAVQSAAGVTSKGANNLFVVFTPPGDVVDDGSGTSLPGGTFLGYHDSFADSDGVHQDYYAVIPDESSVNGNLKGFGLSAFQGETQVISHEMAEAITDPQPRTGWDNKPPTGGDEIGDQAANESYTMDGYQVQYEWSNKLLGAAHALGTGPEDLFINQVTPPDVTSSTGSTPVATFTTNNTSLTAANFSAQVFTYVGGNPFPSATWTVNSITGANGHFVVNATPPGLSPGQHGAKFQQQGLYVIVHDVSGPAAANGDQPQSIRYETYTDTSTPNSLVYNADNGGVAHNFRLVKNGANFDLFDNGNLVFVQAVASTTNIFISSDPGVDSSLAVDYSGGVFSNNVTFNGGDGNATHNLTIENASVTNETFSPSGSASGSFTFSGDANDPGTITFTSASIVTDTLTAVNVTYNARSFTGDTIFVVNNGGNASQQEFISGKNFFSTIVFGNKTTIAIQTNAIGDTVNLTPNLTTNFNVVGTETGLFGATASDVLNIDTSSVTNNSLGLTGLTKSGDDFSGTYTISGQGSVQFSNFDAITPTSNLVVTQADPGFAAEGQNFSYAVTVQNTGPNGAVVTLSDPLPGNAIFVSCDDPNYNSTTGLDTFTLASGASKTITFTFVVAEEGPTVTNIATVSSDIPNTNAANNSERQDVVITDAAVTATATAVTTATENAAFSGEVATFTDGNPNATLADFPNSSAVIQWGDGTTTNATSITLVGGVFHVFGAHTYAEDGATANPLSVTITDNGGAVSNATSYTPIVLDALVTATATPVTTAVEGVSFSGEVATFTDANPSATLADFPNSSAVIQWGDGTTTNATSITLVSGVFHVFGTHTYAEEGATANPLSVTITDAGGAVSNTTSFMPTVADAALTATATAVTTATEGISFSGEVATFTDANPNATVAGDFPNSSAVIHWGDGTTTNATSITLVGGVFHVFGTHTYTEEGATANPLTVTITDNGGAVSNTTSSTPTVLDATLTATATPVTTATEGVSFSGEVATFTDANPTATVAGDFPNSSAVIQWGDGAITNATSITLVSGVFHVFGTHTYAEEGATANPLTVTLTDNGGAVSNTTSTTPTVLDGVLTAGAFTPPTPTEGAALKNVVLFHFTDADPSSTISDYTATVTWGDGLVENSTANAADVKVVANAGGGFDVAGSHTYLEETTTNLTFKVSLVDVGGAAPLNASTVALAVADAALTTVALTPPNPVVGTPLTNADLYHFTDGDPNGTPSDYTATVTWGDGTVETNKANPADVQVVMDGVGGFDVVGNHTYTAVRAGLTFKVVLTDAGGAAPVSGSAVINVSGDLVLNGTGGDDSLVVNATGPDSGTYSLNGGAPIPFSGLTSFTFNGQGGNDSLTIHNVAGGVFAPSGGFFYDGGAGGAGTLTVDAAGAVFRTKPGQIVLGDPLTIQYANVASIQLNNAGAVNALAGQDTADRDTAFIGLTAQERFVQALYLDELGRVGVKAELDTWLKVLNSGSAAVVSGIDHSLEARQHLVRSWYLAYLGRQAQGGEEGGWVSLLLQGKSEETVLSGILATPEFYSNAQALIASGSADERYVQSLYLLLFNRAGDSGSVSGFVSLLPSMGRQGVAAAFLTSPEFHTDEFVGYYNALLHRTADAAAINGLVFRNLDMETVRLAFEASPEFFTNG